MPKIKSPVCWIGVDPGKSGGVAVILEDSSSQSIKLYKMPETERDVYNLFLGVCAFLRDHPLESDATSFTKRAVIEKVWGHTGQNQPGSAMFNFGMGYGGLRMAMISLGIPFMEVVPQRWQKEFSLTRRPNEKKNKGMFKNRIKSRAQELFPNADGITLSTADALLIAEYGRRTWK